MADMGSCTSKNQDADENPGKNHPIEQKLLDKTIMSTGRVSMAAVVTFETGQLRAVAPEDFRPDPKGVKNAIEAFKGNTEGIIEGLNLGNGLPLYIPGKLEDKSLVCTDGESGGCIVYKSKKCLLIICFNENPNMANRLAYESWEHLEENDL